MEPKLINVKDYELSGGGKLGESYYCKDNPQILLKLYPLGLEKMGLEEFDRAHKVYRIGIPCPEPGELIKTTDGRIGVKYERIIGKKSYARAVSEQPELLEQYAHDFADVCKLLHSTKPDPGLFPQAKERYIKSMLDNPYLTDKEKNGLESFILKLPDAETAVHGDLHFGNVIFTPDGKNYFIDLSDFCIGNPLFDIGIVFLQTNWIPDEMVLELYHMNKNLSMAFWEQFAKFYFGPDVPIKEVEEMIKPYTFLRILMVEPAMGRPITTIRPAVHAMIGIQ